MALELGGNSPFVVLEDADVEHAVKAAIFAKFLHQGQICMAINRVIVDQPIYDRFMEEFVAPAGALNAGYPSALDTAIGSVGFGRGSDVYEWGFGMRGLALA